LYCVLISSGQLAGQTPSPTAVPPSPGNEVVKITTEIVQVDLLVVDKDAKQVRDLTAADFEILQDGKPQKINGFSYVSKEGSKPEKVEGTGVAPPPVKITPANAGRIITFIVDDGNCSASLTGMTASREAIQKFVREQMLDTDLVAIYQTRSGSSTFQQYTNDRSRLLNIARKIQWYPPPLGCSLNDGSFFAAARSNTYLKRSPEGTTTATIETEEERKTREKREDHTSNNQVVGTLGVIRYVVKGLQRIPGRKVVFLLSDGLPLRGRDGQMLSATDVLRDLAELSNRSSAVFNTIDARGLFIGGGIEARDEVYVGDDVSATDRIAAGRLAQVSNSRDGLAFLARETGGAFFSNQNFLDAPIKKALSIETGYYLIAFEPAEGTFKNKKFNKVEVKVKRPGLRVVSRGGFIGVLDQDVKAKPRSENSDLYEAIVSPLPLPGLDIDLTAYFGYSAENGNFVRSFFHVKGNEITFVDDATGGKKAVLDVVAVTLNEKNEVVDEFTRTHTVKLVPEALSFVRQNGLVYSADVPIKKPGSYNFRVAVRDASSRMLGSAGQLIQIPDLTRSGLFLSGLTVTQVANGKFALPGAASAANAFSLPASTGMHAIRRFAPGSTLAYAYTIYNAKLDKASGRPKLTIQINLFKDGKLILEGAPQAAELGEQTNWSRIHDFGYMRLAASSEPGNYALQVVVTDLLAGDKGAVSSQWVVFTIPD
jgi:VWFA-related protein